MSSHQSAPLRTALLVALLSLLPLAAAAENFTFGELRGFVHEKHLISCIADLDGDGVDDFVYESDGDIEVRFGQERRFSFATTLWEFKTPVRAMEVADLDGDGRLDLAVAPVRRRSGEAGLVVLWNNGNRNFSSHYSDFDHGSHFLQAVDVDRDGTLDLLSADRLDTGDVISYRFDGRGAAIQTLSDADDVTPFALAAGNLDDDPECEIVISEWGDYLLLDWDADLGGFGEPVPLAGPVNGDGKHIVLADLNRDGRTDIATALRVGEETKVLWLENEGGLHFRTHELVTEPEQDGYFRWIEPADLDGDGNLDLVVSKWRAGHFYIFLNDGSGSFRLTRPEIPPTSADLYSFTIWPKRGAIGDAILPGAPFATDWATISLIPHLPIDLVAGDDGSLTVVWDAIRNFRYDFEFSEDLLTWTDHYQSDGLPVPGADPTYARLTRQTQRTFPKPDGGVLYFRLSKSWAHPY